jgi:hypothetical protein
MTKYPRARPAGSALFVGEYSGTAVARTEVEVALYASGRATEPERAPAAKTAGAPDAAFLGG